MFYGTVNSYIVFQNKVDRDTLLSITLMCWVQPGGQDGPLFNYDRYFESGIGMRIEYGKFSSGLVYSYSAYSLQLTHISTAEVLPTGKWVHVAASYDHNTGYNSLYVNGHLRASQNIGSGFTSLRYHQTIAIGSTRYAGNHFKGKIAEMKFFDVALNEAQIQTSIRQGSYTFPLIVVSLPSPLIPLIIETLVKYWRASQEVADIRFWIRFRKTTSR